MKRLLCVILACVIMLSFSVKANAEEMPEETVMLTDVLKSTNQEEIAQLIEEGRFDKSMESVNLDGQPLMLSYFCPLGSFEETDWEAVKNKAKESSHKELVALKQDAFVMCDYASGSKFGVRTRYDKTPTYVQSILNSPQRGVFLGQEAIITNVYVFRCRRVVEEVEVVYETDCGVFVRYYEDEEAGALELRWEDYIPLAQVFWEFSTSYEWNYSPDGAAKSGTITFLEFCRNPSKYLVTPVPQKEEPPEEKKNYTAVIVIASAVAVVALTAGAILVLRRKKK